MYVSDVVKEHFRRPLKLQGERSSENKKMAHYTRFPNKPKTKHDFNQA
ncbi:hypothetical protein [Neisseria sicca]